MEEYFIGVDVGTGSVRAGVFDRRGVMLASAKRDIAMHRPSGEIAEQSSAQIWGAVCNAVAEATRQRFMRPTPSPYANDPVKPPPPPASPPAAKDGPP